MNLRTIATVRQDGALIATQYIKNPTGSFSNKIYSVRPRLSVYKVECVGVVSQFVEVL